MKMITAMLLSTTALVVPFDGETCETVTVNVDGHPTRINKSDYDAKKHGKAISGDKEGEQSADMAQAGSVLQVPEGAIQMAAPSAPSQIAPGPDQGGPTKPATDPVTGASVPPAPSQDSVFIMPEGKGAKQRFFVIDMASNRIEHATIDPDGYKTMEEAQAAIVEYKRAIPH